MVADFDRLEAKKQLPTTANATAGSVGAWSNPMAPFRAQAMLARIIQASGGRESPGSPVRGQHRESMTNPF